MKIMLFIFILATSSIKANDNVPSTEPFEYDTDLLDQFTCSLLDKSCIIEIKVPREINLQELTCDGTDYFSFIKLEECMDKNREYFASFNCSESNNDSSNQSKSLFATIKPTFVGKSQLKLENKKMNITYEKIVSIVEPQGFIGYVILKRFFQIIPFILVTLFLNRNEIIKSWSWALFGLFAQWVFLPVLALGIIKAFSIPAIQAKPFLLYSCFGGGLGSNIWAILLDGDVNLAFFITLLSYVLPTGYVWLEIFNNFYFEMNKIPFKKMYMTDGNIVVIFFMIATFVIKELVTSKKLEDKIQKTFGCNITNSKFTKNFQIFFKIYLFLYMLFNMIYTFYFKFHMISWFDARQLTLPYLIFILYIILCFLLSRFNNNKKQESYQEEETKKKIKEAKLAKILRMKRIFTILICLQIQNTGLTFLLVILNNLPYTQNLELLSIFATIPFWFILLALAIKYLKNGFSREDNDPHNQKKDTDENSVLMKMENATTSKDEA